MKEPKPRVSLGMPVYNGEQRIWTALESLLAQTFLDFELIISDNASQDDTQAICLRYAKDDPRIRYYRNEENLGSVRNFNRVFELSVGQYFKWCGHDDWWTPEYLARCVAALDEHPDAILVTCHERHQDDEGNWYSFEYNGFRIVSPEPHVRFHDLLWSRVRDRKYNVDLIYSMMRRSALLKTQLFRPMLATHIMLGLELSLVGAFHHVPECLAFRRKHRPRPASESIQWYDSRQMNYRAWFTRGCWTAASIGWSAPLTPWRRLYCVSSVVRFFLRHAPRYVWMTTRRVVALRTRCRKLGRALRERLAS